MNKDIKSINMFKGLTLDAVNKAKSGHPGGALSAFDIVYILYKDYLKFDPDNPNWRGRDRFILSPGHMSMLQYSMLFGVGWLEVSDLKKFRQFGSLTPGHPENTETKGVECTTGPLGQGAAMSLGFSIANFLLGESFGKKLFSNKVYTLVSDGDLQEGITYSSASLAGHLALSNLVWIYDSNKIQLSGKTNECTSDNVPELFKSLNWSVIEIDGHDHAQIRKSLTQARKESAKPTIIIANTIMAKGCATMENSSKTHGAPLPFEELASTKKKLELGGDFYVDDKALAAFRANFHQKRNEAKDWKELLNTTLAQDETLQQKYAELENSDRTKLAKDLSKFTWDKESSLATRNAFGELIAKWSTELSYFCGGSADLGPSNMTEWFAKQVGSFSANNRAGRSINFGVREFPMSAISNALALSGFIPFDATFLSFSDYSRSAIRLGALQQSPVIHEFSHDSFYLGEDGPTHQPVEQIMSLRLIPEVYVFRPADAFETEVALKSAIGMNKSSIFCLSRQKLPLISADVSESQIKKGAYVIFGATVKEPEYIIFATGSEVSLAIEVAKQLGDKVRVVSMLCWKLFMSQSSVYRRQILLLECKQRISIEAGVSIGWERFIGSNGLSIALDKFGASAPAGDLAQKYGFTEKQILTKIKEHNFQD